jgi:hypothetical protein
MTTLAEAISRIRDAETAFQQFPLQRGLFSVETDAFRVGKQSWPLTDGALSALCEGINAPSHYVPRLDLDLRAAVLQRGIEHAAERTKTRLRTRNGRLLGLVRGDLLQLGGAEVVQAVAEAIPSDRVSVHRLGVTDDRVTVELVSTEIQDEVAVGDVVKAGLSISHSLAGDETTRVEPYVLRLVCDNGLTHRECVERRGMRVRRLPADMSGARDLQLDQINRLAAAAWETLGAKLQALRALRSERVEVEALLSRSLLRARLPRTRLLGRLRQAWRIEGAENTAWGAVNCLSRVATHDEEVSDAERRTLSSLAGLLAFRGIHQCPKCYSMLRSDSTLSTN